MRQSPRADPRMSSGLLKEGRAAAWDTHCVRHARADALQGTGTAAGSPARDPGVAGEDRGVFYRGGQAFLHFHEDPAGLFADVRLEADFERFRVSNGAEQAELVATVTRLR